MVGLWERIKTKNDRVEVPEEGVASNLEDFSQASVRQATASDGPGILWKDAVPASLPRNSSIRAMAVVQVQGIDGLHPDTVVAHLGFHTLSTDQVVTLTRSHFAPDQEATTDQNLRQYHSTGIDIVIPQGEDPTLSWRSEGIGRTKLDAIIFMSER